MVHETQLHRPEAITRTLSHVDIAHGKKWTDNRSKLLRELLASMQIIKVFTYESPFLKRECPAKQGSLTAGLRFIRHKEMIAVRKILIIRAANQAMAFSIPVRFRDFWADRRPSLPYCLSSPTAQPTRTLTP
jgi:hypothetical protein